MRKVAILGGGTLNHVRSHLALCAPAFGTTAREIEFLYNTAPLASKTTKATAWLTKMADPRSDMVTNDDVRSFVDQLIEDPEVKVIYFNVAMCDFEGQVNETESGKYAQRLQSKNNYKMQLMAAPKIISRIRKERKDIFLIAFKTTTGASEAEQYTAGLNLLKKNSCNLVLANDTVTRKNVIIVPEEARYGRLTGQQPDHGRKEILQMLVNMVEKRSQLTFTRSKVVEGDLVPWDSPLINDNLRAVVNHCIQRGAYKPFNGNTAGHFAQAIGGKMFLTSARKTNYNDLHKPGQGLVMVEADDTDPDAVVSHGAKPSVGGQSQRIVFAEHPGFTNIVHFHAPLLADPQDFIPVRPQQWLECGSHECGKNTSQGLSVIDDVGPDIKVVMLDNHGPNIVFKNTTSPQRVIDFIEANFDLSGKTGGLFAE